jgi:hypothetical protein
MTNHELARRNRAGILYGICFILFSLVMGGLHWLITGINDDFGMGIVVGLLLGVGLAGLASRRVREMD